MNAFLVRTVLALFASLGFALASRSASFSSHLQKGSPELQSVGSIAFGPEGILFVADQKAATIYALATGDTKPPSGRKAYNISNIDSKLAASLGAAADQIQIHDLAVNPISRKAWLSVSRGLGPDALPIILKVSPGGKLKILNLEGISFSRVILPNAPEDKVTRQGGHANNKRMRSITDMAYVNEQLVVAGLSNEESASNLRSIPFPFRKSSLGVSVEIYHGARGKFETHAPVRAFVPFDFGGGDIQLVAAYTGTPLVTFPLSALKGKAHVVGKTIAELGNRNRPLDIVVYRKDGSDYLLVANTNRGVMKFKTIEFGSLPGIDEKVSGTKGASFDTVANWEGVEQLDLLDSENALIIRKSKSGVRSLLSLALP